MRTKKVLSVSKPDKALRRRILDSSRELFLRSGFVRVTADDIAGSLGISKATLYRQFASKEDILKDVIRSLLNETVARIEALIRLPQEGLVGRLVELFAFLSEQLTVFGPLLVRDLKRYCPELWAEVEAFRREKIQKNFSRVLEAGMREGVFRSDIDRELILQFFIVLIQEFMNPENLYRNRRSVREVFESIIQVFLNGVLSEGGRREFERRAPHDQISK